MRLLAALIIAMATAACRSTKTVTIGWDPPSTEPDGYRVLVDDQIVLDIPPPPVDPACRCLKVEVRMPTRGRHSVSVVAYTLRGGVSERASLAVE